MLILILLTFSIACKKESTNIFNMFDVTLELHNNSPYAVAEYNEVNANDSLVIDFTINSPGKDMYMVCVLKVGATTPFIKIPITEDAKRRSYSGMIGLKADQGVGSTSYRVWAIDKDGVYLGDGYKKITVNVKNDYLHLPNRSVYFADTLNTDRPSFLSLTKGETYSYANGATHAADIDLGLYLKPVFNPTTGDFVGYITSLYSLTASPNPFTPYDITSWAKRKTLFSAPVSGSAANFRDLFKSGLAIATEAKKRTLNVTHINTGTLVNQFIYFLTPEGKYGVFYVNYVDVDYQGRPFINVSIKMQL